MMQASPFGAVAPSGVTCPWCKLAYPVHPMTPTCSNCGGALPSPAGSARGAPPPSAPRKLPDAYVRNTLTNKNVLVILGIVFASIGGLFLALGVGLTFVLPPLGLGFAGGGLLFGGIGLTLRSFGRKSALRQLDALTRGQVAEGQLVSVGQDFSTTLNGRHPFVLEYVFMVNGLPTSGSTSGWDLSNALRRPGEALWVVYLPEDTTVCSLWPPVA